MRGRASGAWSSRRSRLIGAGMTLALSAVLFGVGANGPVAASTKSGALKPSAAGELDCNGYSPAQKSLRAMTCTDIKGVAGIDNQNTWGGKFYDNGQYIGHDEPDTTFVSSSPGSGNSVSWTEKLGSDPTALPTVATPGKDVSHWFELSVAPWFSMAQCDPNSYPQAPCTPNSDTNAPTSTFNGGGSAFMEMQFYPPGDAPFIDSVSCDNTHWCAALNIDSLECTNGFATCNNNCIEPVNFAFIQTNGVPTGPPNPQTTSPAKFIPNAHTLLMNPGDKIVVHMGDAPAKGGGNAFKVTIDDLTLHRSGFMQASAANGFANTSMADCSGTPFNFQPEYSTAKKGNITPWAALQTNISTEYEIGHFEACTSVTNQIGTGAGGSGDPLYNNCVGPYESTADTGSPEADAACWTKGDTHGTLNSTPDEVAGCLANIFQNGDLDFDGSAYWAEWPKGTTASTYPASFVQAFPTTGGAQYPKFYFQTDLALSENTCTPATLSGCTVPPSGPGNFYPYWSQSKTGGQCVLEFGNVSALVNAYGKDAQYGTNQFATLGYPEFEGPLHKNVCA
ncbi:MAG: hypothetical protein WAL84_13765 [Candidatus Dormiibacterota bacterium]